MPDLDTLLKPVRDAAPTGLNLRSIAGDVTFDKIKALRTSVSAEVDPDGKGRDADWKGVARESTEALATKSKDLELAASLADAWARLEGLPGLRDGIRLAVELCERFWDQLHPGFEAGVIDLEVRAMPLNRLGNALASASACALFSGPDPRDPAKQRTFRWSDFQGSAIVDARATGQNKAGADALLAQGYITGEEWHARIKSVEPARLLEIVAQLEECQAALGELRLLGDKQFGAEAAPSLIGLADLLGDIREHVQKQLPVAAKVPDTDAAAAEASAGQPTVAAARPAGPPADREEALRRLEQVAEYFRKNEPHSPIAHLVERAARWGRMPLVEVLREVIPDQNALAKIMDTLGVRPS